MKLRHWFCLAFVALFALVAAAQLVTPGQMTSRYPNISSADLSDLINIARTNTSIGLGVRTNHNMLMRDVFLQASNGLASITYVTGTSNGLFNVITLTSNGLVTYATVTSNALFNSLLNVSNFLATSSIDVKTNQTMLILQGDPVAGSQWYVGTNGTPVTNDARSGFEVNVPRRTLRMGVLADAIHPTNLGGQATNYWNDTNLAPVSVAHGSNVAARAAYSAIGGGAMNIILTNSTHSVISGGYNNFIDTNSATTTIGGGGFNQIYGTLTPANNRNRTIAGGSNNIINGTVTLGSFIGGGGDNAIETDGAGFASIQGGFGNIIRIDGQYSVIGGGLQNNIGESGHAAGDASASVLCGGDNNFVRGLRSFIGGGHRNNLVARDDDYSVIVGGQSNTIGVAAGDFESKWAFIGGGSDNDIANDCAYAVIVGGADNAMGGANTNGFIGGGRFNTIGSNVKFATIPGGERNSVTANYGAAWGSSNTVSGARSQAVGHGITVSVADRVGLGFVNKTGKTYVDGATNATVGGLIMSGTTPIASAGAAETNLLTRTVPAHTLTNSQDHLMFRTDGRFAATSNAKRLRVYWGSEVILDSGSQVQNGESWVVTGSIVADGPTAQLASAELHTNATNLFTRVSAVTLAQTNGISTVLKVTGESAGDGDITNRVVLVWKGVAP